MPTKPSQPKRWREILTKPAVVAAFVLGLFNLVALAASEDWFGDDEIPLGVTRDSGSAQQSGSEAGDEALAAADEGPRPRREADVEWEEVKLDDLPRRAETDGIVAVYSGGDGRVQSGYVYEGPRPSESHLKARTRFGEYGGTSLPILKDRWWSVRPKDERYPSGIKVQWLATPGTYRADPHLNADSGRSDGSPP